MAKTNIAKTTSENAIQNNPQKSKFNAAYNFNTSTSVKAG